MTDALDNLQADILKRFAEVEQRVAALEEKTKCCCWRVNDTWYLCENHKNLRNADRSEENIRNLEAIVKELNNQILVLENRPQSGRREHDSVSFFGAPAKDPYDMNMTPAASEPDPICLKSCPVCYPKPQPAASERVSIEEWMLDETIGEKKASPAASEREWDWICEFCFRKLKGMKLPTEWDWVWQSAVCPSCKERVKGDGGYSVVKGGAYATGPDPRAKPQPAPPKEARLWNLAHRPAGGFWEECRYSDAPHHHHREHVPVIELTPAVQAALELAERFKELDEAADSTEAQRIYNEMRTLIAPEKEKS